MNCGSRNREIRVFSDVLLLLLFYVRKMCFLDARLKDGVTGSSYELTTVIFTHPERTVGDLVEGDTTIYAGIQFSTIITLYYIMEFLKD